MCVLKEQAIPLIRRDGTYIIGKLRQCANWNFKTVYNLTPFKKIGKTNFCFSFYKCRCIYLNTRPFCTSPSFSSSTMKSTTGTYNIAYKIYQSVNNCKWLMLKSSTGMMPGYTWTSTMIIYAYTWTSYIHTNIT